MPDTVIHHAKVYIERGRFAEAVLLHGDRIASVGTNREILSKASLLSSVEKINAEGNLLLPGFNDSHLHLYDLGRNVHRIQACGVASISELVERGRKFIERMKPPKGSVVVGTGWNQDALAERRYPDRSDMDRISSEHAVIISRICGHSLSCNTLAMKMAGVNRHTPQVEGGHIDFDEQGEPLGIFRENARHIIQNIIPPYTQEQMEEHLLYAMRHALENGITSVGSRDVVEDNFQNIVAAYLKLFNGHDMHLRVNLQCTIQEESVFNEFIARGWITGSSMGHPYLTMGSSKLFADGTLGSRTAYLRKPYHDDPSTRGFQIHTQNELEALVKKNHDNGYQIIVHAIGDAAIEQALDAFEKAAGGNKNDLRHGIVHCQITDLPLLRRMAQNDILAFVQPVFIGSDLCMLESRVGRELASTSYAFETMKKLGIKAAYGTDSPVESINPLECIDCAVNRCNPVTGSPEGGFCPHECVDVYTAVDAYTSGSAYSEFAEDQKGRIRAGYLADMTLLDRDIFTIPKKDIHRAQALRTIVGGKMAYSQEDL